jgi:AcrR family transcriptional regulator
VRSKSNFYDSNSNFITGKEKISGSHQISESLVVWLERIPSKDRNLESEKIMNTNKIDQPVGTKQLILQTTLQLLETQGLTNVNIRKIAAQAGVNIAAVNYHFGSKDQVIYEALEILRNNFEAAFCHLQSSQKPPRERLVGFMTAYCETVFTYPNLVKAFISQNLNSDFQENYSNFVRTEGLALIARL